MDRYEVFETLMRGDISIKDVEDMARLKRFLANQHTRSLLKMRYTTPFEAGDMPHHIVHVMIREELGKREHVPNKLESKRIRQERAKANKGNSKGKGR